MSGRLLRFSPAALCVRGWKAGTSGARHGAVVYQSHHHGGDGFVTSAARVCSTAFSTRTTKGFGIGASICCKEVPSIQTRSLRGASLIGE